MEETRVLKFRDGPPSVAGEFQKLTCGTAGEESALMRDGGESEATELVGGQFRPLAPFADGGVEDGHEGDDVVVTIHAADGEKLGADGMDGQGTALERLLVCLPGGVSLGEIQREVGIMPF